MAGALSLEQIRAFVQLGYLSPLPVMSADDADVVLARLRAAEAQSATGLARTTDRSHLMFSWTDALVRHARILEAVESLIGPDIACHGAQLFIKEAGDPGFVSWHQDGAYWGTLSHAVVSAWLALTPSVPENGCMRVIASSHSELFAHTATFAADNLLSRGQEARPPMPLSAPTDIVLAPGEMSLHHSLILHGSECNRAGYARIGFAIRYAPARLSLTQCADGSAFIVRSAAVALERS